MQVASSDGVTVELHDLGGTGDALLIAHATGFCGRTYEPLAAALQQRFHVFALDFRGHGDSSPPASGDFDWAGMSDDVLAVAEVVGAPFHGVGHSMGGAALMLAEEARPGLLRSAFLYEPIVFPADLASPTGENYMAGPARRRRAEFPSKADALLRYASRTPLGVLRADALAAYVEHGFADVPGGGARLKCLPEHEARTFESSTRVTVDRIAHVAVPTVVAVGQPEGEGPNPARFGPFLAEALLNATLLEYRHLGHFGPLQDPDTVAGDIAEAIVD
jgi:pimeloyl-ACP methyl ester carboxylesterase